MKTSKEFWLCLDRLAGAYEAEGPTPLERSDSIMHQFRQMPAIARRELLADLALVAHNMADLYVVAVEVHHELEAHPKPSRHGNVA